MLKKIIDIKFLVLAFYAFTLQVTSQENKLRLTGMKDFPQAGSTLNLTYESKGGPLENLNDIHGYVYVFNDYRWEIEDVKMKKNGNVWTVEYKIPNNCAFIAFKFYTNTPNGIVTDTGQDTGFILVPLTENKAKLPGADLSWGTFRNKDFNSAFNNYFKDFTITGDATVFWLQKEVTDHPEKIPSFIDTYIRLLKVQKPEKFDELGHRFLGDFVKKMKGQPEEVFIKVHNLYLSELKDKAKADSLETVIQNQFPKGAYLRFKAYQKITPIPDAAERNKAVNQFLADFPYSAAVPTSQNYLYDHASKMLFGYYFETKDYQRILALIPTMNFASLNDSYHQNISKALYIKSVEPTILESMAVPMIKLMQEKINDLSYMHELYWSPNQAAENAKTQLSNQLLIQIRLFNTLKKYKEVLDCFELLPAQKRYEKSSINEIHVTALEALNKPTLEVLKSAARANSLLDGLTSKLKDWYLKQGNKESDFPAYLEQLKKENNSEEKITLMAPVSAPAIKVETFDGKPKQLALDKNTIVVIDFWATWCGPCKKAFPAMQQLVGNYKDDKQVEFYFISTQETKEFYKKEAIAYLKEKGYRLDVFFDLIKKDSGTNNESFSKYAAIFKSSGIPRKVVIKNGQIRFTSEGYSGNPGQLVDELTGVINALKKE